MLNSMLRLRPLVATLLMIPALLAGCGDDDPTGTSSVEGTYTLQQVNGLSVPATVYEDPSFKLEVLSGSLILGSDKRYREPVSFRITNKANSQVVTDSQEDTGTYMVSGSTITFTSTDAEVGTYTGTVSDNTVTYTSEGVSVTYRK